MKLFHVVAVLAVFFLVIPVVHANQTGSVGFATPLLTTADASPTGDINTSNIFSLEHLVTTGNESGLFAGLPLQGFGAVSFDTTMGNSLGIADGEFGSFQSSSINTITNTSGFLNLLLAGVWTPGTFNSSLHSSFPASFRCLLW